MKLTEFYLEMQGRPESKVALDMESRKPSIPPGSINTAMLTGGEDFVKTVDLNTIVDTLESKLEELNIELKQMKLHLASMSEENIDEESIK